MLLQNDEALLEIHFYKLTVDWVISLSTYITNLMERSSASFNNTKYIINFQFDSFIRVRAVLTNILLAHMPVVLFVMS